MQYVGERQLLKDVGYLDDVYQRSTESLARYYNRFNKNLAKIDQVSTEGEIIQVFFRELGPRVQTVRR